MARAKTINNRIIRRSGMDVFNKIFAGLAAKGGKPDQLMIDAAHLNAQRKAATLLSKGGSADHRFPGSMMNPLRAQRIGRTKGGLN